MKQSADQADYVRQRRRDRLIRELDHDPYRSKRKIKGPAVCPDCGSLYVEGRWTWEKAPTDARATLCPACHRIKDKVPAAFLTLSGDFLSSHKVEIMNLIQNYQEHERTEHPLKRIMGKEEQADGIVFTFTDAHLARGIGDALYNAYQGEVDYRYGDEDPMLRVTWSR